MSLIEWPAASAEAEAIFAKDAENLGFVMNASRLWAHQPKLRQQLFDMLDDLADEHDLTFRQRAILVLACASTLGDSYCSVAWGTKLSQQTDPETAAGILRGTDKGLSPAEHALAQWARKVVSDPNSTSAADIQTLRDADWTDHQIFGITAFVALRLAFSTVNDALGAHPDADYRSLTPSSVLKAVTYGRPLDN